VRSQRPGPGRISPALVAITSLPGHDAELAPESARSEGDHRRLRGIECGRAHHLDYALLDHDQVIGRIAGRERGLADLELIRAAIGA
jgi:hypothetical protein